MSSRRHPVTLLGLCIAALGASVAAPAWAQQARPGDPAASGGGSFSGLRSPGGNALDAPATPAQPTIGAPLADDLALPPAPPTGSTNFQKPVKRPDPRAKYAGRPKPAKRPLPALVPYPTSILARQRPADPPPPADLAPAPPPPTVAIAPPILRKPPPKVEADPYAPVGVGIGNLRLVPYVEVDSGYDSNPNRTQSASAGSWMLRGETGFALKSDWSVHQLTGSGAFGYSRYFQQMDASRPDGQGKLDLKLDATRDASIDFELRGNLSTQRPGTPGVGVNVTNRPIILTTGATAGGQYNIGDLQLGLHGTLDRTTNENGQLSDGTTIDLANGDFTAYGIQPRIAYQITPGVIPFIEGTFDTRQRDHRLDLLGFARDSNGLSARVGTTFELSRILTGQIAAGYAERKYADARLPGIGAPTLDASLVWAASTLTTVTLKGATTINETTVTNSSGSVNHTGSLEISHALLRNLTLGATGTVSVNDYRGAPIKETTYTATLKADYNLTRSIVFRGSFTHERLISTTPGSDYTANVFLLGLKLQR